MLTSFHDKVCNGTRLSVTISSGICAPATKKVITNSMTMKGSNRRHAFLHGPLVANGDMITSFDTDGRMSWIQAQSL